MNDMGEVTAALAAHGVRRAFGSVQAVINATLTVPPGTVTALIGPNGCGKTTLMLMLAGLLRPDAGSVSIAGKDPHVDGPAARSRIGWMPDTLGTWDSLTCVETLTTFGRAYGVPADEARGRAFALLERVHLAELASQPARVLSRGQKQRLSLARALVHNPSVLILDEPASGLDPRSRVELRELVRELAGEGAAVLISSHVLSELDEMVDDAIFMSKGSTLGAETQAMVADARTKYRVEALDAPALYVALLGLGVAVEEVEGGAIVRVADEQHAVWLLAALVRDGVAVHRFGPVGSAL